MSSTNPADRTCTIIIHLFTSCDDEIDTVTEHHTSCPANDKDDRKARCDGQVRRRYEEVEPEMCVECCKDEKEEGRK